MPEFQIYNDIWQYITQRAGTARQQALAAVKAYQETVAKINGEFAQKGSIRKQKGSMLPFLFQKVKGGMNHEMYSLR